MTYMRDHLSSYLGTDICVKGLFSRYGKKRDNKDVCAWSTVLLTTVKFLDNTFACDHLWFTCKKDFLKTELRQDALISVMGKIEIYHRSNNSIDYSIPSPTHISIIKQGKILIPLKSWRAAPYFFFKYIVENSPRWYRIHEITDSIERVDFKWDYSLKEFLMGFYKLDDSDAIYVEDLKERFRKKVGV